MAETTTILTAEQRTEDNLFTIHLYRDGNWWRAYNWSAYLCQNYPTKQSDKTLKPTRKQEDNNDIVFVGLQLNSFGSFLPDIAVTDETIESGHMQFDVREQYANSGINFSNYLETYNKWKNNCEIKPNKKPARNNKTQDNNIENIPFMEMNECNSTPRTTLLTICQEIMHYPYDDQSISSHSAFLKAIQRKIAKLLY